MSEDETKIHYVGGMPGDDPRIGVYVCHCGSNIAGVIPVAEVVDFAGNLSGVVHAAETM